MTARNPKDPSPALTNAPTNAQVDAKANMMAGALLVSAVMLAILGAILPGLADITGTPAKWMSICFYGAAAAEVGIAFYVRALIKKAHRTAAASGGPVQRT